MYTYNAVYTSDVIEQLRCHVTTLLTELIISFIALGSICISSGQTTSTYVY